MGLSSMASWTAPCLQHVSHHLPHAWGLAAHCRPAAAAAATCGAARCAQRAWPHGSRGVWGESLDRSEASKADSFYNTTVETYAALPIEPLTLEHLLARGRPAALDAETVMPSAREVRRVHTACAWACSVHIRARFLPRRHCRSPDQNPGERATASPLAQPRCSASWRGSCRKRQLPTTMYARLDAYMCIHMLPTSARPLHPG